MLSSSFKGSYITNKMPNNGHLPRFKETFVLSSGIRRREDNFLADLASYRTFLLINVMATEMPFITPMSSLNSASQAHIWFSNEMIFL
jgi:hypothetical protein